MSLGVVLAQIGSNTWDLDDPDGDEFSSNDSDIENESTGSISAYFRKPLGVQGPVGGMIQGVTKWTWTLVIQNLGLVVKKLYPALFKLC